MQYTCKPYVPAEWEFANDPSLPGVMEGDGENVIAYVWIGHPCHVFMLVDGSCIVVSTNFEMDTRRVVFKGWPHECLQMLADEARSWFEDMGTQFDGWHEAGR